MARKICSATPTPTARQGTARRFSPSRNARPRRPQIPASAWSESASGAVQAGMNEFRVACLCAQWCDSCVAYREGFEALAREFPQAEFVWLDIEDDAEAVGER